MNVIFINRFFYPDNSATSQILSDLSFGLAKHGWKVTIITSRLRYDGSGASLAAEENVQGVRVVRVWTSRFGRYNLVGRALDYLTFYLTAAMAQWRISRAGDVVVAKTDPPLMSIVSTPLANWRAAKSVNWMQDVFPEVAQAVDLGGRPARVVYKMLTALRGRSLRKSAMTVAIGTRMAEHFVARGLDASRVCIIPNWSDCTAIRPVERAGNSLRSDWGLAGAFVVGYSGNLGRAHDIETMLAAIELVEERQKVEPGLPPIRWVFIGDGNLFRKLESEALRRALGSVQFRPYQPRERLSESLSAADVHVVILRPEMEGLIVPSKFYGVAAVGRPTIFVGDTDGEIARVLRAEGCGDSVAAGDSAGLAATVVRYASDLEHAQAMGRRARALCERSYDKAAAIDAWARLLQSLGGSRDATLQETPTPAERVAVGDR